MESSATVLQRADIDTHTLVNDAVWRLRVRRYGWCSVLLLGLIDSLYNRHAIQVDGSRTWT